ncbi:hypothetical protein SAMN04488058_1191, partial [Deinococcus reticulitermitis]
QRTELTRHFKACAPFLRHDTLQRVVDVIFAMVTARSVNLLTAFPARRSYSLFLVLDEDHLPSALYHFPMFSLAFLAW